MRRRLIVMCSTVVLSAIVAACGGSGSSSDTATPVTDAPTTTVPEDVYPLTGLPVDDEDAAERPAMVVKIDNHPKARPQDGINQADIIFEENVEKLTRFAAVFHSEGSDPVGPIRSGRFQDINLLGSLNKPLFVWSGGNAKVTSAIQDSDLVDLSWTVANKDGGFTRDDERSAPHNLVAETTKLWTLAPSGAKPPAQQFVYRGASDANASTSKDTDGVKVSMDGIRVHWMWDDKTKEFLRFSDDEPHFGSDEQQLAVPNVVILEVEYSNNYSPTSKTVGSGKAYVFTNGVMYEGKWTRDDRLKPYVLTDSAGAPIKLTPGQTFVEVARAGKTAIVAPGVDPETVDYIKD
ncbi:MAG: DUF3048 domain-containing protein [Actinomycetota bacterium]